ncbi:MAG: alpha/beta fold hydrolase [Hyphomicrobiales bacterium]
MIPGWSQTAAQFKHQIEDLSDRYRVIAFDMRGHGDSDKPVHGYRISRFAKDLHDVLGALDLTEVNLLAHSLGCAVVWCYLDMFGPERLAKLILVDQSPFLTANPAWSKEERQAAEFALTPEQRHDPITLYEMKHLLDAVAKLAGPDGEAVTRAFVGGLFTPRVSEAEKAWAIDRMLMLPRRLCGAASLRQRDAIVVRRGHAHPPADPSDRRQGKPDPMEVAGVDARAHSRLAPRNLRGGRRRQALHVHGESAKIQPDRGRLSRLRTRRRVAPAWR